MFIDGRPFIGHKLVGWVDKEPHAGHHQEAAARKHEHDRPEVGIRQIPDDDGKDSRQYRDDGNGSQRGKSRYKGFGLIDFGSRVAG